MSIDTRATSTAGQGVPSSVSEHVRSRQSGYPLPAEFYTSPEIFDLDVKTIFGTYWFFAAVEAQIPEAGDYVTVDVGPYSVIVLRDDDEEVRALHNVCRHRGARILNDAEGSVGNIVCGYHYWTYGTDGKLLHAPGAGADFQPSCFALKSVAVRSVAGLIYLCLADEPPTDFDPTMAQVAAYLEPHNLAGAKVAAQVDIIEDANWKLVMENNRECYHCEGHPELSTTFFLTYGLTDEEVTPKLRPHHDRYLLAQSELEMLCEQAGLAHKLLMDLEDPATGVRIMREALDGAGESFSLDGTVLCDRPLGDFPSTRMGRCTLHTQPNMWGHMMADHAVVFSALPISPTTTRVRTTWLVHADCGRGRGLRRRQAHPRLARDQRSRQCLYRPRSGGRVQPGLRTGPLHA